MAGEVPEDEEALMTMFEPPEDIATYPGYPNLGNDDNFFITVSVKPSLEINCYVQKKGGLELNGINNWHPS